MMEKEVMNVQENVCDCESKESKKKQKMEYRIEGDVAIFTTSQGIEFTVDAEDANRVSQYSWRIAGGGYVQGWVNGKFVYLHRFLLGVESDKTSVVDHVNHDKLNNCRSNLRICSSQENNRNRKDVKGYSKTRNGKYASRITVDGKRINLGNYDTPEQANSIRVMAEKEFFGNFSSKVDSFDDAEIVRLYEEAMVRIEYLHQNKARIEDDVVYVTVYYKDISKEVVVNLEDYHIIKNYKWCINKGTIVGLVNGEQQVLARFLMGLPKGDRTKRVKFKDGDKSNYRRNNLEVVECKSKNQESNGCDNNE